MGRGSAKAVVLGGVLERDEPREEAKQEYPSTRAMLGASESMQTSIPIRGSKSSKSTTGLLALVFAFFAGGCLLAGPDTPKAKGIWPEDAIAADEGVAAIDAKVVDEGVAAIVESPARGNHQNGGSGTKEIYHEDIRAEFLLEPEWLRIHIYKYIYIYL